ncbi:MAG: energy transducer TonB [Candidatus Azobacteroides sp.]|nr:energy transducer TonB [Candidatus Azobacteroides sp.]
MITKRSELTKETDIKTNDEIFSSKADIGTKTVISNEKNGVHVDDLPETALVVVPPKPAETIERFVEQKPSFPGGEAELMKYLNSNLRYPVPALENEIEGRVVIEFVVSKTGEISHVKILQSLHPSCDKEAERLIKKMPKWIPGKQNGNPVNVYYTIPIRFKLEKSR